MPECDMKTVDGRNDYHSPVSFFLSACRFSAPEFQLYGMRHLKFVTKVNMVDVLPIEEWIQNF
jgi:hypothetical protein